MAYFVVQCTSLCAEKYITTLYQMSEFKADLGSFCMGRQTENWQLMPLQAELLFFFFSDSFHCGCSNLLVIKPQYNYLD